MVSMRRLPQLTPKTPPLLPLIRFSPGLFVVLQEILYQTSFALVRLWQKIMHFQNKSNFFFQLIAGRFVILLFRLYVFLVCLYVLLI